MALGASTGSRCRCATQDAVAPEPAHQSDPLQSYPAGLPILWISHPHTAMVRPSPFPAGVVGWSHLSGAYLVYRSGTYQDLGVLQDQIREDHSGSPRASPLACRARVEAEWRSQEGPARGGRQVLRGEAQGCRPLGFWRAGAFSVCCVFCHSIVRFKNGQGSNLDGGNYHVYENGSLEIKMIRKEDQGIYTCVATNILGKAENQVRLEVKGKGVDPH